MRRKSGVRTSIVVPGGGARIAVMVSAKCCGAAVVEVVAVDRRDDDVFEAELATASATRAGSPASSASGLPGRTLQNAQARVQIAPMIIMVAWRFSQHSPMLGQLASWQTVCRPWALTMLSVSRICGGPGSLDAQPRRLLRTRRIRARGLFGVAGTFGLSGRRCGYR